MKFLMVTHRASAFEKIELSIKNRAPISENDGSQDHGTINNRVRKVRNQNIGVRLPHIRRRYPRYSRAPNRLKSDAIRPFRPRLVNDVKSRDFRNRSENQSAQRTWRTSQREYRLLTSFRRFRFQGQLPVSRASRDAQRDRRS